MHGSFVGIILPIFAQLAIFSQLKLTMKCGETKTTSPSKMWNTMIFGGILILFFYSQCFFFLLLLFVSLCHLMLSFALHFAHHIAFCMVSDDDDDDNNENGMETA